MSTGQTLQTGHTWNTHDVLNQVDELTDFNLLEADPALAEALQRNGAARHIPSLSRYAQQLGERATWELAEQANRHTPELHRFDARGRIIDAVEFHPSWHTLLGLYRQQGLISLPFEDSSAGRWSAWAAGFYLHGQVEQGTLCPATMTTAAIPLLQKEPALWQQLQGKLFSHEYDPRDLPVGDKASMWLGMGMTEKQGGSDVRANTTVAMPVHAGGRGGEYLLRGHKWFFSAPMCDAHLVVARMGESGGQACFYVPRWRPDGSRNAVRVQRLKDKVGNRSNSSSEVEFEDAWGILMGEEGRGIPTIIEMATYTRLNCVLGSAAILRSATVQALAYARRRSVFGKLLAEQPLMRTVLADLALESEAALQIAMRLAQAYERGGDEGDPLERAWKRIMTPAAKLWVCKRGVELTGEAMEVLGGNGYVDTGVMARLFREAPVNSIWEGSGNVMCLDVLRAISREPDGAQLLLQDLIDTAAGEPALLQQAQSLARRLSGPPDQLEAQARRLVQDLVLLAQACLLRRHAPPAMADGFIATRLGAQQGAMVAGAFDPAGLDIAAIVQRALPA
ncbi:acyl-CoA dehydrogenase domain protein [Delftia acidovorans SPH-1]|uniref:Acyl-CoA dehydrogenase domain protein n=1 Tax=Delftia acidovorans (strain DSM 14801 / SPH-1) TaxID=398578 RepID=A9BQR4_DELAS|nr:MULTISPECIES: acyl-CoA dehydrogenase family protein [Delftia]MBA4002580.1 DNA alkylation response protein [Delftia sp.]OLE95597.1 MAG: DNA alkylation response protein [Delftia sp. 13_1_40CM_3_66_6]ABX32766.1 acyl-CoA dehydrogenase domain protein [Delftia acidovorans SPH-1]MCP4019382.1 DNA alkylation response protein [Delftia sp.]MCP4515657.1 DNA alkylation response protein [Delftia sp.]